MKWLSLLSGLVLAGPVLATDVSLQNPLDLPRENETIELPWTEVVKNVPRVTRDNVVVIEKGNFLVSQVIDLDHDRMPESLIFQTSFAAKETKTFQIQSTGEKVHTEPFVFGRAVPERRDDFAWESDRIAFRMYGPSLQTDNDASSGVDVWVKRTRSLVINKWYKQDDYHKDHGEGLDAYKVGKGRGAGGLGIFLNDHLYISKLYTKARILENGPIRLIFELEYAPWEIDNGAKVNEIKRITLDAHQNLNRFESTFTASDSRQSLPVAIGLALRDGGETKSSTNWAGYWEPEIDRNGHIAVGMILSGSELKAFEHQQTEKIGKEGKEKDEVDRDLLALKEATPGKPFVYYAGAGWSKSGDFADAKAWFAYLDQWAKRIASPIEIKWKQ